MRGVVNFLCIAGAAVFLIVDSWPGREVAWLVIGAIFALWAFWIGLNLLRRMVLGRITPEGIAVYNVFSRPFVRWDQMTWAEYGPARRSVLIGYQAGHDAKERIVGWHKAALGPDNLADIITAFQMNRPNLPGSPYPDWKSTNTKDQQK